MRSRRSIWIILGLLLLAGAWLFWRLENRAVVKAAAPDHFSYTAPRPTLPGQLPASQSVPARVKAALAANEFAFRLSNTTASLTNLMKDPHAILLENALIDTRRPLDFSFPKHLQAQSDPGAYIVQARGPITAAFRAALAQAGAQIVSYIPNDAYLVRVTADGVTGLAASPLAQSVVPYEPYYKIQSSLLNAAVGQKLLPDGAVLNLGLFADAAPQTIQEIEKLGGRVLTQDRSPFGPVVRVQPPANWTALAALPGVQIVEPFHPRVHANDLSRVTVGVATDTQSSSNYFGLTGKNVMVAVNDSGIDATHPDLLNRVFGAPLTDTDGHGTHVAGIIAGDGTKSTTVMNAEGSIMPATNGQFRGMAPLATLLSMNFSDSDQSLQEAAALTNALISNNSWGYGGDNTYDLAAASYDAATRDALPEVTGSQPVLFVFAAGNDGHIGQNGGNGDNNGGGGTPDTVTSPGTAKNVITVGALEQLRNITNWVTALDGTSNQVWLPETDTGYQVAGYSSRGNVGVGIEGANGRFKPDVAAPGTFVVSARSAQWATNAYYNPTNYSSNLYTNLLVGSNSVNYYSLSVPQNAVSVAIQIQQNPFTTNLQIYVSQSGFPDPTDPTSYDFFMDNEVSIPPDGGPGYLATIQGAGFNYAVGNNSSQAIRYNILTIVATTNDLGDYYQVLEGMNDSLGVFYRYESGTSMAAADVSGVLALMQDFFYNTLHTTPSPALLKAMLINGARPTLPSYNVQVNNTINYEGWGRVNLPNSLPTNSPANYNGTVPSSIFLQDQSPTNALATGDSHTFNVNISTNASALPLRLTLAWTDPPGDPIAAIKLVNKLELIVTNVDNPANPIVYYGNDFSANGFNTAQNPTNTVSVDSINNVQNIIIPQPLGSNYTVTVIGSSVNVNAVSTQTNNAAGAYAPNVVQDYALVISAGDVFTVTDKGVVSNPTGDRNITFVTTTNKPLMNQFVGANSPVLNAGNTVLFTTNTPYGAGAQDTIGMTNQWHFYVVTNTLGYPYVAFITFTPPTLSIPRMGVFAGSTANATLPQANIDLYATGDANLLILDPLTVSNCINEVAPNFGSASLARGGAKFVTFSNSTLGQVYYAGVKSEDQMASEYTFLPVFSQTPFSQNNNGNQILAGVPIPADIPAGSPSVPGFVDIVAICLSPIPVGRVVVTNTIQQTDVGDLVSSLSFNNSSVVLMSHDSPNTPGTFTFIYDDSASPLAGSQPSHGPGSLQNFIGQNASAGVWVFHLANSVTPFTGSVLDFGLMIQPQVSPTSGETNTLAAQTGTNIVITVPPGATNLTISVTNITPTPPNPLPLEVFVKFGAPPTTTNFDEMMVVPTAPLPNPGSSLSIGPSANPPIQPGNWNVLVFNNNSIGTPDQTFTTSWTILPLVPPTTDFASTGATPILDDAVTYSDILVTNTEPFGTLNVGIVVQHPRISDLVFHLISPDGTRVLLMENRGGQSTNGAGATILATNVFSGYAAGGPAGATNTYDLKETSGTIPITWNFYTVPDTMDVYYQGTNIFSTGLTNGIGSANISFGPGTSTEITVVMDATNHPAQTLWNYTIGGVQTNFVYLTFTEDTNRTTTPIKFAPPPFVPNTITTNVFADNFDTDPAQPYLPGQTFGGWKVLINQVNIATNPPANSPPNLLALDGGAVSNTLPTVAGRTYILSYQIGSSASEVGAATNANWQSASVTFTATQNGTPLVLDASGSSLAANSVVAAISNTNALFDDFTLTEVPGNLYYQPEESLNAFNGGNAAGDWRLEIQDDRAGAGLTNMLMSWELQFVFSNTNPVPASPIPVIPGTTNCNITPANDIFWYQVSVPLNAFSATNILLSADLPVNLLFNQNAPDTNGAIVLLSGQTNGISILSATSAPPLIPGSTYYLGVQNTNSIPVDACIEVNFGLLATAFAFTEPATQVTGTNAQLNGMATPNGYPATAWFQWGTTTNYGNQTLVVGVGAGLNVVYTTNLISSLAPNVAYHFRLVVSNVLGVVYGFDQILDEANVVAWGANYAGQLDVPTNLNNATAIAGAYDHSLALNTNGLVAAWGDNLYGEATVPANLSNVVAVAGGESYSLALQKNSGTVAAWGSDIYPGAGETNAPAGLNNVVLIASGQYSSLALKNDGTVVAWGANLFNPTNIPAGLNNVVSIAGGTLHNLAIRNDGTVTAWGDNGAGQTNVPTGLSNVVAIAAGSFHSLALKNDGTVVAWGYDNDGQTNVPAGLSNVVAVAAGGFHSLALLNDGSLRSWGDNSVGQGNVPGGLTNFVAIAAGYLHSLALTPESVASLTNVVLILTPGTPETGTIVAGGITYYQVSVPINADIATNRLLYAQNGPLNVWFTTNMPPSIASHATLLLAAATNGVSILYTNSAPNIIPGTVYYLGLQNTNSVAVNYGVEVDFHLVTSPPNVFTLPATNITATTATLEAQVNPNGLPTTVYFEYGTTTNYGSFSATNVLTSNLVTPQLLGIDVTNLLPGTLYYFNVIAANSVGTNHDGQLSFTTLLTNPPLHISSIIYTNIGGKFGFLLTWFAPSNDLFQVQWNNNLASTNWSAFTNIVSYNTNAFTSPTHTQFNFFDDGSQTPPGLPPARFYRLILLQATNPPPQTNVISISSITHMNNGITNGFLLKWFAPSNDLFRVQWTGSLPPTNWSTFTNIVSYNTNAFTSPTNTQFNFFDDGSQTGGTLGTMRFYRLILLQTANTLTLPAQSNLVVTASTPVTVTNTATDSNPSAVLTYSLVNAPTNAGISTNGIITWTNASPAGLAARFTTIVTDNGLPPLTATNTFTVFVAPFPAITNVMVTATNVVLKWTAPTNDQFQVQWATNLAPVINWFTFPAILTSANGTFAFTDTNAPLVMKFYRLWLLP